MTCLSSCWLPAPSAGPSPEDALRQGDAVVCLHLGSGSHSLLRVDGHMQGTCWVSPGSGEGFLQKICVGNLGALRRRREQGSGS